MVDPIVGCFAFPVALLLALLAGWQETRDEDPERRR